MCKAIGSPGTYGFRLESIEGVYASPEMKAAYTANIIGAFSMAIMDKVTREVVKTSGLSASACHTIVTIGTEPGSTIDEIRKMLDLDHSSVVRAIARLEKIGAVEKKKNRSGDGRAVTVYLSMFGKEIFAKVLDARSHLLSKITSVLTTEDLNSSIALIHKVMSVVVEEGDDQHRVCRLCDISACDQRVCPVNLAY